MTREQYQRNSMRQNKFKHSYKWKWIIWIATVIILFYGYVGLSSSMYFQKHAHTPYNQSITANSRLQNHQPVNVLLMGTDTGALGRNEKRGRTDTMMIDTINPQKQKMTLTSIPRDTPANYQGNLEKINSVYTMAGGNGTEKYVQDWLGVPVNYYVLINMGGLDNIINKIGGVTVIPPITFKYGSANVKKGQAIKLNGYQALDYCRMRHQDPLGDYGRQIRQRQVLFQVFNKLCNPFTIAIHPQIGKAFSNNVQTNLSSANLMTLFMYYRHANRNHVSNHIQGNSDMINGQDFEQITPIEKQQKVQQIMNDYNN